MCIYISVIIYIMLYRDICINIENIESTIFVLFIAISVDYQIFKEQVVNDRIKFWYFNRIDYLCVRTLCIIRMCRQTMFFYP